MDGVNESRLAQLKWSRNRNRTVSGISRRFSQPASCNGDRMRTTVDPRVQLISLCAGRMGLVHCLLPL